jgi:hypothetical protein
LRTSGTSRPSYAAAGSRSGEVPGLGGTPATAKRREK